MKGLLIALAALVFICTGCVSPSGSSQDAFHTTFRHTVPGAFGNGNWHQDRSRTPTKEELDIVGEELSEASKEFALEFVRRLLLSLLERELSDKHCRGTRKEAVRSALLGTGVEMTDRWLSSPRSYDGHSGMMMDR